jgi:hypothetical protein
MKQILLTLMLATTLAFTVSAQQTGKLRKHYYILIDDSTFVNAMPEQGATLKAYFKNDTLYKIETWFGFNFGEVTRDYYYWNDTLSLVNETQKLYNATTIPKIDPDTIKISYSGRYIFQKNKLTGINQKGSYSISDTPQTKEETQAALVMLSEKYRGLAYEKRKSKKNRIKIKSGELVK